MLTKAQNGQGLETLARQFNLSPQQAKQAIAALTPAFSQGLKRNTADPRSMSSFLAAMTSGRHAQYFDDPSKAVDKRGIEEGKGILGHLFGSKDLSRAVASQAAQVSGVGPEVLKQMLPAVAAMVMGGLFKQSTGQLQAASAGGAPSNPLGEIIGQMMRQAGGATAQSGRTGDGGENPLGKMFQDMLGGGGQRGGAQASAEDNPLGKMLQDIFGGGAGQVGQPQARQQAPGGENPLGQIFEQMLGGGQQQARNRASPQGTPRNPLEEMLGKMFETGAPQPGDQQTGNYQKGIESIFDQFTKGMDRAR